MIKLPEQMLMDEAEMRAFYDSVGISRRTTKAAIKARRNLPVEQDKKTLPLKGKKRKAVA
jgi:hypothetical protein